MVHVVGTSAEQGNVEADAVATAMLRGGERPPPSPVVSVDGGVGGGLELPDVPPHPLEVVEGALQLTPGGPVVGPKCELTNT